MSLQKVKAKKKPEVKNKNEAKGTYAAFLLSSEHAVFFPLCFATFLNPFAKVREAAPIPLCHFPAYY